jgi:hypothetical protein
MASSAFLYPAARKIASDGWANEAIKEDLSLAQDDKLSKQSFEQKRETFSTGLLVSEIAKLDHDFTAG